MARSHLLSPWLFDGVVAIALAAAIAITASVSARYCGIYVMALAGIVAAGIARAIVEYRAATRGQDTAAAAKNTWRARIFPTVLTASAGSRHMLGEQIADATDRIESLDGYHARFLPLRHAAVVTPLLIAAAAAPASWVAALIMLVTLIPFAIGMALAGSATRRAAARQLAALGRLSGLFVDRVRAMPVIVAFGAEERITRQLDKTTRDVAARTITVLRIAFLSGAVIEFFAALSVALVAVYCGFSLLGLLPFHAPEQLDLGRALYVLILAPEFYLPMRRLAAAYHDKQLGEAAMERLNALKAPERPAPSPAQFARPPALAFEQVVIDYGERRVGPFSFDVPRGRTTVLSGETGCGKSSLLHALLGLAPLAGGRISLDGEPLVRDLRGCVSWAGQATMLLPGNIADNIRMAWPQASDDEIDRAARQAGLGALLASRADGFGTMIDPRGSGVSGGERRRIGLARALLRDAPLWLLDEPTADLDAVAAAGVIETIGGMGGRATILLATHDRNLCARADHHVVLG
ncbi:MAG: thiol reductant ABC exporter subunit CydD [Candidatus Sphingomonas colombiensis]|nr:thiol reductant ABC exporter subunit CydD [Sphingomonas sp.]WEK43243.1 MAG: thiol reductant ABC exporter subunit CydD [Sphingomonas sp.]